MQLLFDENLSPRWVTALGTWTRIRFTSGMGA